MRASLLICKIAWLWLSLSSAALAQFTTVTGTVTDPNGLPYAFGMIASSIVASSTPVRLNFQSSAENGPSAMLAIETRLFLSA